MKVSFFGTARYRAPDPCLSGRCRPVVGGHAIGTDRPKAFAEVVKPHARD